MGNTMKLKPILLIVPFLCALCVLHELLLLLQHLGKAAGRFEVEGRSRRGLLLRLRGRAGALGGEGGEGKAPVCFVGGDRLEE